MIGFGAFLVMDFGLILFKLSIEGVSLRIDLVFPPSLALFNRDPETRS